MVDACIVGLDRFAGQRERPEVLEVDCLRRVLVGAKELIRENIRVRNGECRVRRKPGARRADCDGVKRNTGTLVMCHNVELGARAKVAVHECEKILSEGIVIVI